MPRNRGTEGNPGREGLMAGVVKIRAYNTRSGHPLAVITVPTEVMREFGWQPGMYLQFYPTTGRELVLVRQDQALLHLSPDYDLSLTKMGKPMPGPRPNSVAEREVEMDEHYERLQQKLAGIGRGGRMSEASRLMAELDQKLDEELGPEEKAEPEPKPTPKPKPARSAARKRR